MGEMRGGGIQTVQGKKRQGSPCTLGEKDLTCDN